MEFNAETVISEVTIQDNKFAVPQPFSKGHICTENESAALNQILVENTRNNFAKRVKTATENGTFNQAEMQTELDKYLASYEFGVRRGGGPTDPIGKEATSLAKELIKNSLRKKGFKLSDLTSKKLNEMAAEALEKYPNIRKEAESRVKRREKLGDDEMEISV